MTIIRETSTDRETIPSAGDLVWRWHREGDARYPLPEIGRVYRLTVESEIAFLDVDDGEAGCNGGITRCHRARAEKYGTLATYSGGSERAVAYRLLDVVEED